MEVEMLHERVDCLRGVFGCVWIWVGWEDRGITWTDFFSFSFFFVSSLI